MVVGTDCRCDMWRRLLGDLCSIGRCALLPQMVLLAGDCLDRGSSRGDGKMERLLLGGWGRLPGGAGDTAAPCGMGILERLRQSFPRGERIDMVSGIAVYCSSGRGYAGAALALDGTNNGYFRRGAGICVPDPRSRVHASPWEKQIRAVGAADNGVIWGACQSLDGGDAVLEGHTAK